MDHPLIDKVVTPFGDFYSLTRQVEFEDMEFHVEFPAPAETFMRVPDRIYPVVTFDLKHPVEGMRSESRSIGEIVKVPMNGASSGDQRTTRYENARRKLLAACDDDWLDKQRERALAELRRRLKSYVDSLNSKLRYNMESVWVRQSVDKEWFSEQSEDLGKVQKALEAVRQEIKELRMKESRLISQITEAKRRMIEEGLKNVADEIAHPAFRGEIRNLMSKPVQAERNVFY